MSLLHALDPVAWLRDELSFACDPWQARLLRSSSKRKVVLAGRQVGKSTFAAAKTAHRALFFPSSLVLLISPSERQSGELFRTTRNLLGDLKRPPKFLEDAKTFCTLRNKSRIVSLPSSESTVRGFARVNLIVEDEASRVPDDLHLAVRPMLATTNGELVLCSTPAGMSGHFFDAWTSGGDWEREMFRSVDCSRISQDFLSQELENNERAFKREYACMFGQDDESVFDPDAIAALASADVKPWLPVGGAPTLPSSPPWPIAPKGNAA